MRHTRRVGLLTGAVVLVASLVWVFGPHVGRSPAQGSAPVSPASASDSSPMNTAFVVMMENTDWSRVKGSSNWPYLNSLLPSGAHAENYRSGIHPSLPNYVTLESGQTFG